MPRKDFFVVGIDVDKDKIAPIIRDKSLFYVKELGTILRRVIDEKLVVSTDYGLLDNADLVFITLGTPTKPNGKQDQTLIVDAVKKLTHPWKGGSRYKVK